MADETRQWGGMEDTMEDPEETRVIFCALDSFAQYAKVAHYNVTHMRRQSFYALPRAHWQILAQPPFSFLSTLDRVDDAIESNADLCRAIVRTNLPSFLPFSPSQPVAGTDTDTGSDAAIPAEWAGKAKHLDIDKARSTIRQFFRDWSSAGAPERAASYGPVHRAIDYAQKLFPDHHRLEVLVPGAGLGRLVFDLVCRGCNVEGNEISYHQLMASSYILNNCESAEKHTIFPWIHTFSNHQTRNNHLRSYRIPDVHVATALAAAEDPGAMSMSASDFLCGYAQADLADRYDVVASVFFLDTAPNLIRYLEVIRHCLRPGGVLVNVGPLLWHFENNAPGLQQQHDDDEAAETAGSKDGAGSSGIADPGSFELADDEVMALLEKMGFVVEWKEVGLRTPYMQDTASMLQTEYRASAWMARKMEDVS